MKKKIVKCALLVAFIAIVILAIVSTYKWVVSGEQYIKISTSSNAYTNSNLYVSIISQKNGLDLDTKSKVKLLNSDGKKVKNAEVTYDGSVAAINVPEIEAGNYFIEATVSSKEGKDTVQKEIYISDGKQENITITLDKGIYKPGDSVNFRALLTNENNDEPITKEANICIYDGNDNKVYNENVTTSDYGIVSGKFTLANEVNSGIYKLVVKTNTTEVTKQFKVNPYITPKYEIKIGYDKQNYLVGDTAKISINANYFFGEPVSNANYTVYINEEKYKASSTDELGNAIIDYEIKEAKTYTVKVEVVDSSNYFVEETSTFAAGTDIFEVELLPEYGKLQAEKTNDIYVFTKKADGTPIKTYITVSSGNFTKQVATDENGIGKFSISVDNNQATRTFKINAVNMNGESVEKTVSLDVETNKVLLSTDKVKYKQGEEINLNISSILDNTKNVYFFKNDKLIKMLSTEADETSVNLDNEYGLIDIYVSNKISYSNENSYKKTVFIKPDKALNISVSTDKAEYKPGDNIKITLGTSDENNKKADAALLVSMLDNSILSLADNDLSIDNIKLALSNIQFSDELDAATLYSCIVDDESEQAMMGLLLKQSNRDLKVSETIERNYEEEEKAASISVISITIAVIIIISYLCFKFPRFRNFMKHSINLVVIVFTFYIFIVCIIEEYFWGINYAGWLLLLTAIVCLAIYIAWIAKLSNVIFKTSISLFVMLIILMAISIVVEIFDFPPMPILIIIASILLVYAILTRVKKLKNTKFITKTSKTIMYICKFIGALVISFIIGRFLEEILDIYVISMPITIMSVYSFNYLFNKSKMKELKEDTNKETVGFYIVCGLAGIGVLAIISFIMVGISSFGGDLGSGIFDQGSTQMGSDVMIPEINYGASGSINSSTKFPSIFEGFGSDLSSKEESSITPPTVETETVVDDNIRDVFLESMCFIPELVTTNGQANVDMALSDNITTWTIQTVGNTKDGRIGYANLNNVKVFKEFFVDFELPKNLVETDKISIPVTVYNYTNNTINTTLKIKQEDWFELHENNISVTVEAEKSKMVYVPITILKTGTNKFRVEAEANLITDIIEKELTISPKGYKVEKVVSTGMLDADISEDILILEDIIENTASAKVKIYASSIAQTIEGMENIFRMPTGCFEQISSSLYPNILALKYMQDNGIINADIREKALNYISSGYQKLLSYEVKGESGGYSLYGDAPAETVLTAYGLMQLTDLKEVYNVDENVIQKMTNFLYKKQNLNGSFTITGSNIGGASSRENLALNAYITWALSESDARNEKLTKSIEYLKGKLDDVDDNYTLALIANALANVDDKQVNNVIKRLVNNININGNNAYITSNITDYYGSRNNAQTVQTVALTSMALSKTSYNMNTNKMLINYLIGQKDKWGTWYSTQATILALKALNEVNEKSNLENQTIVVNLNSDEQKIEIKDNPLELYQVTFDNLGKENKFSIDIEKGSAYYEVVQEYYVPYEKAPKSEKIEISIETNNNLKVNEILEAKIKIINRTNDDIYNGMVTIAIPQGFTAVEESLMLLQTKGIIEKYETTYSNVNIYLRDFQSSQIVDLNVKFRAMYPVDITGMAIRAYDYYNPEIEGRTMPIEIKVEN